MGKLNWHKIELAIETGERVLALAPVIISASRTTDIPAFHSDWFVERWKLGYFIWRNPFNGKCLYVSLKRARAVVFWTKNPEPIFKHLDFLNSEIRNYYFHFTLNNYEGVIEPHVPDLLQRIDSFIELSEKIGKERVIWRFDPLLRTNEIDVSELLNRIEYIGDRLCNHTTKLIFSFVDLLCYKRVAAQLKRLVLYAKEFDPTSMHSFAEGLSRLNIKWGLTLASCAEKIDLSHYGIVHNRCIDDHLLIKLFPEDTELMTFLGVKFSRYDLFENHRDDAKLKSLKDRGQREACGCIMSKDIGVYNSCRFGCGYCYARRG